MIHIFPCAQRVLFDQPYPRVSGFLYVPRSLQPVNPVAAFIDADRKLGILSKRSRVQAAHFQAVNAE